MTCFTGSKLPVAMNARLYASMVAARRVRPRHAARKLGAGCCAARTNGDDCTSEGLKPHDKKGKISVQVRGDECRASDFARSRRLRGPRVFLNALF